MDFRLTPYEMNFLVRQLRPRVTEFKKNEVILRREQEKRQVGFVLHGLVYLCVENELFDRSILRFFRPGEYFSLPMLPETEGGVSYMITKSSSKIAYFNREDLRQLCQNNSEWSRRFSRLSAEQLEKIPSSVNYILHQKSIRSRLLCFFRQEAAVQGSPSLTLPIPYSDLADYLAVDRTAMMKEVKKMKAEGLISGANRSIVLHEESGLASPGVLEQNKARNPVL